MNVKMHISSTGECLLLWRGKEEEASSWKTDAQHLEQRDVKMGANGHLQVTVRHTCHHNIVLSCLKWCDINFCHPKTLFIPHMGLHSWFYFVVLKIRPRDPVFCQIMLQYRGNMERTAWYTVNWTNSTKEGFAVNFIMKTQS